MAKDYTGNRRYRILRSQAETCYGRRLVVSTDLAANQAQAFLRGVCEGLKLAGWTPDDRLWHYLREPNGTAWNFLVDWKHAAWRHAAWRYAPNFVALVRLRSTRRSAFWRN